MTLFAMTWLFVAVIVPMPSADAAQAAPSSSAYTTWDCTSSPCPWGAQTTGHAANWPADLNPIRNRHGYTTSTNVYAPGTTTSGYQITVTAGTATVYAGTPNGSHRQITTITTGNTATLPAIGTDEHFSLQADSSFSYTLTPGTPPAPDPNAPSSSAYTTWDCTSSPCPWGAQTTGHAANWPADLNPIRNRHGYTTSTNVYAPGTTTSGYQITVTAGTATVYAGTPNGSHRQITTITTGNTATLPAIATDEHFSLQNDNNPFSYTLTPGDPPPPIPPTCQDPMTCDPVSWTPALWICNLPGCTDGDWVGGVIGWPSWSAYATNGRSGGNSRTVYAEDGTKLHPYMGAWADGCEVTVVTGEILVIEWQRGEDVWRETVVGPGETHTIDLVGPENGAMLETPNNSEPFTASLANCTPAPLDQ
ncbi:hypothetical protein FXB39_10850 [Nocardioides sp. BGMRC 2183]|nr:hypothetical protein FXB39_10850 [Nocardioides sp. BGMRC 2183]